MSSLTRPFLIPVLAVVGAVHALVAPASAQPLDHATLAAIRDEGLRRPQVMDHISWLSDIYGPRVTGTPAIEQAGHWTMEKLREWGLSAVHEEWIASMRDLGVTTMGPRSVSGTDHVSFDAIGLPGFQFIQDRLEYNSRTHHSNIDVVDRVQRDDVVQMAVVAEIFAYNTAMRDEVLPRKPRARIDR